MRLMESLDNIEVKMTFVEFLNVILQDCKPFLKELTSQSNIEFMYSGRDNGDDYFQGRVRKDRKPSDTNIEIHNDLNTLFQKKFGYPARSNSMFCTAMPSIAEEYGDAYAIFPIGKYKLLWSDTIDDLYMTMCQEANTEIKRNNGLMSTYVDMCRDERNQTAYDEFGDYHKKVAPSTPYDDFYYDHYNKWVDQRNSDIEKCGEKKYWEYLNYMVDSYEKDNYYDAINSQSEIMVTCNKYWAILGAGYSGYNYGVLLESYFNKFDYRGHRNEGDFEKWWNTISKKIR